MKITRKTLLEWVGDNRVIRYKENLYRTAYNGRRYFLYPIDNIGNASGGETINFYNKSPRIFGLETNKR